MTTPDNCAPSAAGNGDRGDRRLQVTVAICTWNRANLLDQTLTQLRALRIPDGVDWEIIVVNNRCTDDTDAVVARHAGALPVVLCREWRQGQSYARNHAVARARGDFILWTDDDVLVDPDWMAEILRLFQTEPADIVFGKVTPWWESGPPGWFSPAFHGLFALLDYGPDTRYVTDPLEVMYGVNMAFRRDAQLKLEGFCEDLGVKKKQGGGGEDIEIFRRALRAGMRVLYTPKALIQHFIPNERCTKRFYRNRAWGGSENHYVMLRLENAQVPWLLGLPRYFLRQQLGVFIDYFRALLRGDRSQLFFYELKIIRIGGLFSEVIKAWRQRVWPRKSCSAPSPALRSLSAAKGNAEVV
jgi:glycosyltransferase involved in cell wall biosynthesis